MKKGMRLLTSTVVMGGLLLFLAACGSKPASAPGNTAQSTGKQEQQPAVGAPKGAESGTTGQTKQLTKVSVGIPTGAEIVMPFYLAIDKEFFKEEGLDVEVKEFPNGPQVLLHMAQNEFPMAIGVGWTPMLQAAAQGLDIKILMSVGKGNAPVVAGPHIKEFRDLDGKVVGTPGLGTIQNSMLSLAAKKYGIKFGKVVHGKITDLPIMLEKGEIDAFTGWEWIAADAVNTVKGAHYVLDQPVIPNAESIGYAVRADYYNANQDTVKRFVRGYMKGVRYFNQNRKDAIKWLAEKINRPEKVVEMALERIIINLPEIYVPSVVWAVEDAIETGRIKKEVVPDVEAFVKKYIDTSLTREVMKEVGL